MTVEAERSGERQWGRILLRASIFVAAVLGLVAFSVVLAQVTLTPSPASEDLVTSNLRPGRSLRQYAEDYTFLGACKQAGGNLLLGMPFGVLLPILVERRLRMIRIVLLTMVVMVVVELMQGALVAGRAFDIDDVILNTSGALLGYLLVGRRISHRYHTLGETSPTEATTAAGPDKAKTSPKAGTKGGAKAGTKGGVKVGTKARAKAGVTARAKAGVKARTKPRTKAGAGRSGSAPARVRALIARIRNRRPGRSGGAPRPGRRS
ncbi:VanZ family protein [Streptomyces sp. NBC_00234]|uniref:VanZ family protein n=1 Tax=Streptomyces sp. NBC_00234 TaxID=2903638 RepID=UPI002E2D2C67|nr:VanZ family protein [Streptomyces sp. NBC_00234]